MKAFPAITEDYFSQIWDLCSIIFNVISKKNQHNGKTLFLGSFLIIFFFVFAQREFFLKNLAKCNDTEQIGGHTKNPSITINQYIKTIQSICSIRVINHLWDTLDLKLVSTISYQFFIFSSNDSPSKTAKKKNFISSKKLFSFSRNPHFCNFSFLSTFSRFKRTDGSGINLLM